MRETREKGPKPVAAERQWRGVWQGSRQTDRWREWQEERGEGSGAGRREVCQT